jgi:hypothetical protein
MGIIWLRQARVASPKDEQDQERPETPEIEETDKERAEAQAEVTLLFNSPCFLHWHVKMRRKQRAALDKHFGKEERNLRPAPAAVPKKISTMEQASLENLGWRQLDAQQEFLRWDWWEFGRR